MFVDVLLTPRELPFEWCEEAPRVAVALDVLRATTVMVTAFELGSKCIVPVSSSAKGRTLVAENPEWLLAGEEKGLPPQGFHFGNSPLELMKQQERLTDKTLVMSTTNGTRLLNQLEACLQRATDQVLIGALSNRQALCHKIQGLSPAALYFCCAGREGQVALEDTACAGYLLAYFQEVFEGPLHLGDGAHLALSLIETFPSPLEAFLASRHGQYLQTIGLGADIGFCATWDQSEVVPHYTGGRIHAMAEARL